MEMVETIKKKYNTLHIVVIKTIQVGSVFVWLIKTILIAINVIIWNILTMNIYKIFLILNFKVFSLYKFLYNRSLIL